MDLNLNLNIFPTQSIMTFKLGKVLRNHLLHYDLLWKGSGGEGGPGREAGSGAVGAGVTCKFIEPVFIMLSPRGCPAGLLATLLTGRCWGHMRWAHVLRVVKHGLGWCWERSRSLGVPRVVGWDHCRVDTVHVDLEGAGAFIAQVALVTLDSIL